MENLNSVLQRLSGFVAIIGRPNSGKSTLLNSILKTEISIVTPKAQTTRERVLGILTEPQGQIVFIDTPGIHRAKSGGINEFMVSEARDALEAPSVIWYLVDPNSALLHEEVVFKLIERSKSPVFLLMNKSDVARNEELKSAIQTYFGSHGVDLRHTLDISATQGKGVGELMNETWKIIPPGPLYFDDEDQLSDRPTRFFVAEKIREQLFLKTGQEIPYSSGIEIEKFDEKSKPPRIEATIFVERDSQKGMVVGKGGTKIKEIGQAARATIETFLGTQVFLGLRVKVLKDWTKDELAMKRLGYHLPKKRVSSA